MIAHHKMLPIVARLIKRVGVGQGAIKMLFKIQGTYTVLKTLIKPYHTMKVLCFDGFKIAIEF